MSRSDLTPERIRYLLNCKGMTFAKVARASELNSSTVRTATRLPNIEGEWAIAFHLGIPASEIWPSRYDQKTGERLKPQPSRNYKNFPRLGHCQKDLAA